MKTKRIAAMLLAGLMTVSVIPFGQSPVYAAEAVPQQEVAAEESGEVSEAAEAALQPEAVLQQEAAEEAFLQPEVAEDDVTARELVRVTFDAGAGHFDDGSAVQYYDCYKDEPLSEIPVNPVTDDGSFVFSGWFFDTDGNEMMDPATFLPTDDVTIHALYAKITDENPDEEALGEESADAMQYMKNTGMTIDANGGKFPNGADKLELDYPNQYLSPEYNNGSDKYIPTWAGHVFLGWYADKECKERLSDDSQYGDEYNLTEVPGQGATVYAGWTANYHTVRFVFNGTDAPYKTGYYWDSKKKEHVTELVYYVPDGRTLTNNKYPAMYMPGDSSAIRNTDCHCVFDNYLYTNAARTEGKTSFYQLEQDGGYLPTGDITFYADYRNNCYVITMLPGTAFADTTYFQHAYFDYYDEDEYSDSNRYESMQRHTEGIWSGKATCYLNDYYVKNTDPRMKFQGWYQDAACTKPVEADEYGKSEFTSDMTVYAAWYNGYKVVSLDPTDGYYVHQTTGEKSTAPLVYSIMSNEENSYGDYMYRIFNNDLHKGFLGFARSKSATKPDYACEEEYRGGLPSFYAKLNPASDLTLYAIWQNNYFKLLNYDACGGTILQGYNEEELSEKHTERYSANNHTAYIGDYKAKKDGFAFGGWYFDKDYTRPAGGTDAMLEMTQDYTLYAKWLDKFDVTFDCGAGKLKGETSVTMSVVQDSSLRSMNLSVPDNPTPDPANYAFVGWYTDPARTKRIERSQIMDLIITGNTTFYAKYAPSRTITFHANGGRFASASTEQTYTIKVADGEMLKGKYPTVLSTDEKVFRGWFTDATTQDATTAVHNLHDFVVTGDQTFYAGYTECYLLTFNANHTGATLDGSTQPIKVKVVKGNAYRYGKDAEKESLFNAPELEYDGITDSMPSVVGYGDEKFPVWNTKPDGTGADYVFDKFYGYQGDATRNTFYETYGFIPTQSMDFYINWKEIVTVTFDANGGTFKEGSQYPEKNYGVRSADGKQRVYKVAKGTTFFYLYEPTIEMINLPAGKDQSNTYITWCDDAAGTKVHNDIADIEENITVYAKYNKYTGGGSYGNNITLTLNAGDGYFGSKSNKTKTYQYTPSAKNSFGVEIPVIDDAGKAFCGWYYDDKFTRPYPAEKQWLSNEQWNLVLDKGVKNLYAKYEQVYTVTLDANGGYFEADEERTKDPTEALREDTRIICKPKTTGYGFRIDEYNRRLRRDGDKVFAGWYLDPELTVRAVNSYYHDDGDIYYNPVKTETLYAKWVDYSRPEKIEVAQNKIKLNIGQKTNLQATVTPAAENGQDVCWYLTNVYWGNVSVNKPPVKMSDDGTVTGLSKGYAEAYAELNGVRSEKVEIEVTDQKLSDSISLNVSELHLINNDTATVTATVVPETSAGNVVWTSNNTAVATVEGNGATAVIRTGSKEGSAVITAKLGKLSATLTVNVSVPIRLSTNELLLTAKAGVREKLTATISGSDLQDKNVEWSVSAPGALTVEANGREAILTPNPDLADATTVTVTAKIEGTEYQDECLVTLCPQAEIAVPVADIGSSAESTAVRKGTYVTFTSASLGADLYYTTNGTDPSVVDGVPGENVFPYTDRIRIDDPVTIKIMAYKEGYKPTAVLTFAYTIDDAAWGEDLNDRADLKALFNGHATDVPAGLWYVIDGKKYSAADETVSFTCAYTGDKVAFNDRIEVYHGYEKLVENRDYTIAYSDNTNAVLEPGSADPIAAITQIRTANARVKIPKVTIKGKGNYKSAKSFMFGIERADIDTAKVTTGNEMLVVAGNKTKLGNIKLNVVLEGKALKAKKDYELTYYHGDGVKENNLIASPAAEVISQSGSVYTILISAKEGSNLTGDRTVKVTSVASPDDLPVVVPKTDLSKVKIAGLNANVEYAGRPLVIADLFKEDNVTRNPDGNRDTDDAWTAVTLYTVDGKTKAKTALKKETDYSVSMNNTGIPGKFTLTFTGKGDFEGLIKKTITIKPYNLKTNARKNLIIDEIPEATYTKAGVTPSVTVKLVTEWNTDESGIRTTPKTFIKLKEGSDYTLTYKNNVKPQTKDAGKSAPTVTIKGTGNFTGANATATFTIKKADVMQVELSAQDVIYNSKGKAGYFMAAPKLMDDGKPVAVGKNKEIDAIDKNAYEYFYAEDTELTDGTMKYAGSRMKATDPVPAGTLILVGVEVSVTAANSPYEQTNGTPLFGYYRVLAPGKDISKMSAGLKKGVAFTFQNGESVLPVKNSDIVISYKEKGVTYELDAADYEILSVTGNRFLGKATVTVRGRGQYGGIKTFTFKIDAMSL